LFKYSDQDREVLGAHSDRRPTVQRSGQRRLMLATSCGGRSRNRRPQHGEDLRRDRRRHAAPACSERQDLVAQP